MNSILSSLKNMFGRKPKTVSASIMPPMDEIVPKKDETTTESTVPEPSQNFPEPAPQRKVIQPPILAENIGEVASDKILIKAEPAVGMDSCKFMVNRKLFDRLSWYFPDFESASGSAIAEAVFSLDGIESMMVHGSTLTVTRVDKTSADWKPLGKFIGEAVRSAIRSGNVMIAEGIRSRIPNEDVVRSKIQDVIDHEVNPGVAGHGGNITLTKVEGNAVTIQMGGGCQGCSAADLTLKQGIHNSFRKAFPEVGAIYDETDHKAGMNPYYS